MVCQVLKDRNLFKLVKVNGSGGDGNKDVDFMEFKEKFDYQF